MIHLALWVAGLVFVGYLALAAAGVVFGVLAYLLAWLWRPLDWRLIDTSTRDASR